MKKILFGLLFLTSIANYAQGVPQGINYQAVARDNSGSEITSTSITVRFSIGGASVSNSSFAYQETHSASTNQFGLFNAVIGQGTPSGSSNAFNTIQWDSPKYLLVEVDFGSGYEQMGVATPFVSVPYALMAKDVLNKELPSTATTNDVLTWDGSQWVPQAGGSSSQTITTLQDNGDGTFTYTNENNVDVTFDANIDDADADPANEIQDLLFSNDILNITGSASSIDLSIYNELPASATTGQVLTWDGSAWVAQNSGTGADNWGSQAVVTDATLSGNGTTGSPLGGFDGDYNNLTNQPTIPTQTSQLTNDSGFLTAEVDGDNTNEIQDLSISGNDLLISGGAGTSISSSAPSAVGQVLTWDGSQWIAQNPGSGADNWGTQYVITDATLSGNGTSGSPLGGFDGDYNNLTNQPTIPTQTSQLTNDSGFLTAEVDGDNTNEIQDLSISGNQLLITNGTGTDITTIPPVTGEVLTWSGTSWEPSTLTTVVDTDDQFIDVLQMNANTLEISLDGDNVPTETLDLSQFMDNTDAQTLSATSSPGTATMSISGGNTVSFALDDADADPNNEIQNLSIVGNTLAISNGTGTPISATSPTGGQVLTWNAGSNAWEAQTPGSGADTDWTESASSVYNTTKNIGIGTATPNASTLLHVEANASPAVLVKEVTPTSGATFVLESKNQWMLHSNEGGDFKITNLTTSQENVIVDGTSGNVSIGGILGPISKLDVNGQITMRQGATDGFIPVSDANGTMTWTDPTTITTAGDADSDPTNEFQTLTVASSGGGSTTLDISNGNTVTFSTDDADADPTNEYNIDFAVSGTNLTLKDAGNTFNVPLSNLHDGNGIYGGSGSLSATTGITYGSNNLIFSQGAGQTYVNLTSSSTGQWNFQVDGGVTSQFQNDGDVILGSYALFVDKINKKIGINTGLSPSATLDVQSQSSASSGIAFNVLNSSGLNLMRVRDDGWVGINTSTAIGAANLVVNDNDDSGYAGMYINSDDASTGKPFYGYSVNNSALAWTYLDVNDNNNLKFYYGADRMTITSGGNVGIGTTNPSQKLDVNGTINIGSSTGEVNNNNKTGAANLVPIAYGTIDGNGNITASGTGNWTSTRSAQGTYYITITGETYHFQNHIGTVSALTSNRIVAATSSGGQMLIYSKDFNGAAADAYISFVVYKP